MQDKVALTMQLISKINKMINIMLFSVDLSNPTLSLFFFSLSS